MITQYKMRWDNGNNKEKDNYIFDLNKCGLCIYD